MTRADVAEPLGDGLEGFLPGDFDEIVSLLSERMAHPIRVGREAFESGRFGADIALTEGVVLVASDVHNGGRGSVDGNLDSAMSLTERAIPVNHIMVV